MPPVALRKEGVDRNYLDLVSGELRIKSLSARRAWIEITAPVFAWWPGGLVALRKEGVDRNTVCQWKYRLEFAVALRKEGVDRNNEFQLRTLTHNVALRKESVDRNAYPLRPAWRMIVALRKESVDRNL